MATRIYSAGQLNQRVQLQARSAGENAMREQTGAWANIGSELFAKAEPLGGKEVVAGGAQQQVADYRFVIRYRDGVSPSMRLVWKRTAGDLPFDIISAEPVDGGIEWLEILAVHGARDGRD